MGDRDLHLWMNERWYNALVEHLGGEDKLRQRLDDMLDDLINILPDAVCAKVSQEIQEEQRQWEAEMEANRRFAVFEVTEHGGASRFLIDGELDSLNAARLIRNYLRGEYAPAKSFVGVDMDKQEITSQQFDEYVHERLDGGRRVTGTFKIDLDAGTFATMDRGTIKKRDERDCWHRYQVKDVLSAAFHAFRREYLDWRYRLDIFQEHLTGRELTPAHALDVSQVTFGDEIMEMDNHLNFYVAVDFDPDRAFGANVCTDENDDWVNVYANYDIRKGRVCDELEVDLCMGDGTERNYIYPLTSAERKALLKKMDAYCQEQTGQSLKEYSAQLREQGREDGPTMSSGPAIG